MVDRQTVYYGQLVRETDILQLQQNIMVALARLSSATVGATGPYAGSAAGVVNGFTCTPTGPASLSVIVTPGEVYQIENLEATQWSSLSPDISDSIIKQGILLASQNFTITPPGTVGQSQVFLIEVQYADLDTGSTVLPYFNSLNPASPFNGPGNSGTAQNTVRKGLASLQVKAGVAATTGTQQTPTADAGWVGMFAITVAQGQSTITAGNIVTVAGAPFVPTTLPGVPPAVVNGTWNYAADTGSAGGSGPTNATTGTGSAVLSFGVGNIPAGVATGQKVIDQTTSTAITGGQTVLSINSGAGTVTMTANANATVGNGDIIVFSNNTYAASISPAPTALMTGMQVRIKAGAPCNGTSTFNLNGLGTNNIVRATGANTAVTDITAAQIVDLTFDGTHWQIANYGGSGSGGGGSNTFNTTTGLPYVVDSGSVNTIVGSFSPVISSLTAGLTVEVKIANTNTSTAVTLQANSTAATAVFMPDGSLPQPGLIKSGMVGIFVYDGTHWQLEGWHDAIVRNTVLEANITNSVQSVTANNNAFSKLVCLTTSVRSTLLTSTFDGTTFTVGSGEDGLWSVKFGIDGSVLTQATIYVVAVRFRSGVGYMFIDELFSGWTSMDTLIVAHATVDLQVGDTINFYTAFYGPSGSYALIGPQSNNGGIAGVTNGVSNLILHRLVGLH